MNFEKYPTIQTTQTYLDQAIKAAKAKQYKSLGKENKLRNLEVKKVEHIGKTLARNFNKIVLSFPDLRALPDFYAKLVDSQIGKKPIKQNLAAVSWAAKQVSSLTKKYAKDMARGKELQRARTIKSAYIGRVSSVLKQVKKSFDFLETARRVMKAFPDVDPKRYTVVLVGFPNVGKTTLLYKLTGSKPEINSYAFTTKGINAGNFKAKTEMIQLLDTPGTLNRLEKMNKIEYQAHLCSRYLAKQFIYVFDLMESYPMDLQKKLYEKILEYKKPVWIYISKKDLLKKDQIDDFKKRYKNAYDVLELKKKLESI